MGYPTLKQPRLCRVLSYVVVIGAFLLPAAVVYQLSFVPELLKALAVIGALLGLLVFLVREFLVLMSMDITLACLSCYRTARTQYPLTTSPEVVEKRLSRFGSGQEPLPNSPQPAFLRYRFSHSLTAYSRGIERMAAVYHTDLLDGDTLRAIVRSGKANASALSGTRTSRFLDSAQKKAPMHCVMVLLIFSGQVEDELSGRLYDRLCKFTVDGEKDAVLPCVVDLKRGICVFDGLRMPYVGFEYPVKNRGIRLIRRMVFGGKLPLKDKAHMVPMKDPVALDQSLWAFWQGLRRDMGVSHSEVQRQFQRMRDRQILMCGDVLFLKWGEQGIALGLRQDKEQKRVRLETIEYWTYPKSRPISKKVIGELQRVVEEFFGKDGWTVSYYGRSEGETKI